MCRSIGWGFCAVLVWQRVYTLVISLAPTKNSQECPPTPHPLGACVTLDIDWLTKKLTSTLLIHWRVIFLFKIHIKARFLLSGFPNNLFIFPTSFSYVAKPFKGTGKEFRKNLWNLLCCSEFCQLELSKRDFRSAVDRLNSNVLHLCFTQVGKIITDTSIQCLWTLKRKKKQWSP